LSIALESTSSNSSYSVPAACSVCSSAGPFSSPLSAGRFRVFACPECGVVFLFPQPSSEQLNSFYDEKYYGKGRRKFAAALEATIATLTLLKWKRLRPLLGTDGRLLDVGCGRGTLVRLARAAGFEAYGLERPFPGAPFLPHVFYRELTECGFPEGHFQTVVIWHVLEHLPNPLEALQEIHRLLRPGGWLSVAVPNFGGAQARASGADWFHLDLPRHFWHFEPSALQGLLERSGFRVVRWATLSVEYDWFGTLQSWMNRAAGDQNRLYSLLKGERREPVTAGLGRLAIASALALPALASAVWDAARGQGGTLTITAQKP
jgi:SAM-dependent methyltransferase